MNILTTKLTEDVMAKLKTTAQIAVPIVYPSNNTYVSQDGKESGEI